MKATVEQLRKDFAFSERHACGLIGLAVSTYRHQPQKVDETLREQLIALARRRNPGTATGGCMCCCFGMG